MSQPLVSLKTRNRLFAWIEQWPYAKLHEEFYDAGFGDYGFIESDEDSWEYALLQNKAFWTTFKSSLDWSSPSVISRLGPIIRSVLTDIPDGAERAELLELLRLDGFQVQGPSNVRLAMFNLLVSAHPTAWEGNGRFSIPKSRFKEDSGDAAALIDVSNPESMKALERLPTILMYERGTEGRYAEKAYFGEIRDIQVSDQSISFRFHHTGNLSQSQVLENSDRLQIHGWEATRTHWAIKDGDIPQDILRLVQEVEKQYDIVLSYAGEDRAYVSRVAAYLWSNSVDYYYDQNEAATLWGKNLTEHFDKVFTKYGRFCVMFVSKHYAAKIWPTHERRSALCRQLKERREYILPARFDDTAIDGLHDDLAYVDLRGLAPEELGDLILQKLGRRSVGSAR